MRTRSRWCWHQESNPGPTDYKSVALPTELRQQYSFLYMPSLGLISVILNSTSSALRTTTYKKALAMTYFHMRKPHTIIGAGLFHY